MLRAMLVIRGLIAALMLAAVIAAGVVISHGTSVKDAGQPLGYVPPEQPHSLAVIGDSYSSGTAMGGNGEANWAVQLAGVNNVKYDGGAAVEGSGYLVHPAGGKTFAEQIPSVLRQHPDWLIMWGAFDDLAAAKPVGDIETAFRQTLTTLMSKIKQQHLSTHVVVVGPVWLSGVKDSLANSTAYTQKNVYALADYEQTLTAKLGGLNPDGTTISQAPSGSSGQAAYRAATKAPDYNVLNYVDARRWFAGGNQAYIGIDREHPIDLGDQYIAYRMQRALANFGFGVSAPVFTSVVPPYIHSRVSTEVKTSISSTRVTFTRTQTVHDTKTVTQPAQVITVTVAPTP